MGKFVFKLEPLYEYRQRMEEISQREFSEALRRLEDEEVKLNRLKAANQKAFGEMDEMKEKGAGVEEINLYYLYIAGLKNRIGEQEKILKEFRELLELNRKKLIEASKGRKVIEIMKERSFNSYIEGINREEQKTADDMVNSLYKRSGNQ
ncbi:MAG: flagellar export protein FliJ [Deltaproteobacteria bacterium]|nr:flagellar export protein FliJ [Deltaproteobacteria bacterium]